MFRCRKTDGSYFNAIWYRVQGAWVPAITLCRQPRLIKPSEARGIPDGRVGDEADVAGADVGGAASVVVIRTILSTGGAVCSGNGTTVWSESSSGGVNGSGSALLLYRGLVVPTGGISGNGAAIILTTYACTATGGTTVGGAGLALTTYSNTAMGGATSGGAGLVLTTYTHAATQGVLADGSALLGDSPPVTSSRLELAHHETMPNPGYLADTWAVADGEWEDPDTWSNGVPTDNADAFIGDSYTVTITSTGNEVRGLEVQGTLTIARHADTGLTFTTIAVSDGGTLDMGTVGDPVLASVTSDWVVRDEALPDQSVDWHQFSNGVLVLNGGTWRRCGAAKSPFVRLAADPVIGSNTLTLESAPTGWRVGDKVALPFSNPTKSLVEYVGDHVNEEFTIVSVVGSTVTLDHDVEYTHPGAKDKTGAVVRRAHLVNLTRNVKIRSENPSGTRGHTLFTERSDVDLRWTQLTGLGRTTGEPLDSTTVTSETPGGNVTHYGTNQVGRYPEHAHHCFGPVNESNTGYQLHLEGNVSDDCKKWGHVLHGTSYAHVKDCVAWDFEAAGFSFETGSEWYNHMEGCFAGHGHNDGHDQIVCNGYWLLAASRNAFFDITAAGLLQPNTTDGTGSVDPNAYLGHGFHLDLVRGNFAIPFITNVKRPLYRGADVMHGAEGVEYETVGRGEYGFEEFDGCEAYGVFKNVSLDHASSGEGFHLKNVVAWGFWQDVVFIYGGGGEVLIEGMYAYRWAECAWQPNTWYGHIKLVGGEVHNYDGYPSRGIERPGDAPAHDQFTVKDVDIYAPVCIYLNYRGKNTEVQPNDTTGANRIPSSVQCLDGVTTTLHATASSPVRYQMQTVGGGTTGNTFLAFEQFFVFNHEGNTGENYQLFFDEQDPDADSPISPLSNQELYDQDGRSWGGELMPVGAAALTGLIGGKAATLDPPSVVSAEIHPLGHKLLVAFDRYMTASGGIFDQQWWAGTFTGFSLTASGGAVSLNWKRRPLGTLATQNGLYYPVPDDVLCFDLSRQIAAGETITLSYSPGLAEAMPGIGSGLEAFTGQVVTNNSTGDGSDTTVLGLEAAWYLGETSGTRAELIYPGVRDLAETGTLTTNVGPDGDGVAVVFDNDADSLELSGDWLLQNARTPANTLGVIGAPLGSYTFAAWVRSDRSQAGDFLTSKNATVGYYLALGDDGARWRFGIHDRNVQSAGGSAPLGDWKFILAEVDVDNETIAVEVDGVRSSVSASPPQSIGGWIDFRIGARDDGTWPFRGAVYYPRIWHRVLTSDEKAEAMDDRVPTGVGTAPTVGTTAPTIGTITLIIGS